MEIENDKRIGRRSFFISGAAAISSSACSYGRIIGAKGRISLGHIGVGKRGRELASVVADLTHSHNVEMTAVCDLWRVNRDHAAKAAAQVYDRAPRSFTYAEDLLELKDADAVIISTADSQNSP